MSKHQRKRREPDPNVTAKGMLDRIIAKSEGRPLPEPPVVREKNPAAVALSKLGASKGGKARAEKLSAAKRKAIAKKAATSRWSSRPGD